MNSDGIKRSVRAKRHDRAAGDAPSLGRMARMPGTGLPKGSRRQRRKSEGRRRGRIRRLRKRIIKSWSVLLSASVLVILGLTVWLWLIPQMDSRREIAAQLPATEAAEVRVVAKFPSPTEAEALAMVQVGLTIRDPATIVEYFRTGTASPQEIVDFLHGLEALDGSIGLCEWLSSMDTNALSLDGVVVNFKGTDKPRNRLALLTPDEVGKWKIDFEAFARRVNPPWTEILEPQTDVAQVRVYAVKDNYYNGVFSDDNQWICYGLASPDTDQTLLAYCLIGSPQAAALDWIFSAENRMTRMTLEIRRVAGADARQFQIEKVLAADWVVGDLPFDSRFK